MEFNDNGKRKVYNVDLDGTLTNGEPFWKQEPTINPAMLEKVIELYKSGNVIIIWTARQWQYAPETVGWLIKNRVPYHGIQMGKGGADCYIDDKSVLISDLLKSDPAPAKKSAGISFETASGSLPYLGKVKYIKTYVARDYLLSGVSSEGLFLFECTNAHDIRSGDNLLINCETYLVMARTGNGLLLQKDWIAMPFPDNGFVISRGQKFLVKMVMVDLPYEVVSIYYNTDGVNMMLMRASKR